MSSLLRSFLRLHFSRTSYCTLLTPSPPLQHQRTGRSIHLKASIPGAGNANLSKKLPSGSAKVLFSPTVQAFEDAELTAVIPLPNDARIALTDRAAEQLRILSTREKDSRLALRVSVESGGCHGYQYAMELTSERRPDDYQFAHPTIRPSSIVVDAISMPLLAGATVDFATELIGSSFRVMDNPQAKGTGCGCGVSWELKGG
ncbi:hypothetical protein BD410DRAFT_724778 [Rickenella mellea]|uniref:Core domain-containing protein n=1 Tax=Rickenella mellea TaxID=50990 RepID=A0A4Y7Q047_9AGAM|nr:hypothetical protein BD410DRAFT_724778 [Rickenella mellea]